MTETNHKLETESMNTAKTTEQQMTQLADIVTAIIDGEQTEQCLVEFFGYTTLDDSDWDEVVQSVTDGDDFYFCWESIEETFNRRHAAPRRDRCSAKESCLHIAEQFSPYDSHEMYAAMDYLIV